ncbi:MAG: hypothetical protein R3B07_22175 [Polyangiaceae bacterium]
MSVLTVVRAPCIACGEETDVQLGQAVAGNQLYWSQSIRHCEHCGATLEADSIGFPPAVYRDALLKDGGEYGVEVVDQTSRAAVASGLRETLELSLPDALAASRAVPGVVWRGTQAEAEWVRRRLAARGVQANIVPCPEPG